MNRDPTEDSARPDASFPAIEDWGKASPTPSVLDRGEFQTCISKTQYGYHVAHPL